MSEYAMHMVKGVHNWQIIQQTEGVAEVYFSGYWKVHEEIQKMEGYDPIPSIRVVDEENYNTIIPWTRVNFSIDENGFEGKWEITLSIRAGGLYRIECGIDVKSPLKPKGWIVRGDVRFHVGVGDLFVIAGQSNAAGFAKDWARDESSLWVHLYRNSHTWDLACHPFTEFTDAWDTPNEDKGVVGFSPFLAFGKMFYAISHRPVGFIQTACGGTGIKRWDPGRTGDLYHNMIERIRECGGKVAGILWYQGCSDAEGNELEEAYCSSFSNMVNNLRRELNSDVPFFTVQLNREVYTNWDENFGKIRNDQRILADTIPKTTILTTLNCSISDNVHNNAHSCIEIGEKWARQCAHYLYGSRKYDPPLVERIELEDGTLRIALSNITRYILIVGTNPEDSGFCLEDEAGIVPCSNLRVDKSVGNILEMDLDRKIEGSACLSFARGANPTRIPPVDDDTYLPLVSFYRLNIPYHREIKKQGW